MLLRSLLAAELRRMKEKPGPHMTMLGSGSLIAQFAPEGLIDAYQIVVNPVAIGRGRTLFAGLASPLALRRTRTRTFGNGNVRLCYRPGP
ncbi:MAG TPA: dihydrofolate reductase family protein [Paracoccaceae bacterium]|nr:dihydrofolate reductase family protein [Paracoccaceae bacterium]